MDPVLLRLDDLERRLAVLEAARPAPGSGPVELVKQQIEDEVAEPPPLIRPAAPPPRVVRLEPLRARREAGTAAPGSVERWLGGVLLARVGIAAVVLAAAYFAQLAYRNVTPELKVVSLYALAVALLGTSWVLRARAAPRFLALLEGGAVAVAYVAGLAATLKYGLVGPWVGLALVAGAAALGAWLGCRRGAEPLASVSVLGALAGPQLLGLMPGQHELVLALAVGVNAWAAWGARRFGWTATRVVAFIGAFALVVAWLAHAREWTTDARNVALHAMLGLLLLPEVLDLLRRRALDGWMAALGLVAVGLTIGSHVLLDGLRHVGSIRHEPWAWLTSLGWFTLALVLGSAGRGRTERAVVGWLAFLAGNGLVLGFSAAAGTDLVRLVGFALLALALLAVRRRAGAGHAAAFVAGLLAWAVVHEQALMLAHPGPAAQTVATFVGMLALALVPSAALVLGGPRRLGPPFALGTWLGAALGGALLLTTLMVFVREHPDVRFLALTSAALWFVGVAAVARLVAREGATSAAALGLLVVALTWLGGGIAVPRMAGWTAGLDAITLSAVVVALASAAAQHLLGFAPLETRSERQLLGAVALALPVLAGGREVHLITRHLEGAWSPILMSVYVTLVAAGLLGLGFRVQARGIRIAALALFLGITVKVGLSDLAHAPLELRVLVSLVLGLALLGSAYGYARRGAAVARS